MIRLNIIGAGKLGRTLGRLWTVKNVFTVQDILNRTVESGRQAAAFIGAGRAVAGFEELRPAEWHLIATEDDRIEYCAANLALAGILRPGDTIFHCSGYLPSTILAVPSATGVLTASLHPLRSFAEPETAAKNFAGTNCALEGNPDILARLEAAVMAIGGVPLLIESSKKAVYHAAAVLSSNGLTALLQAAVEAWGEAGLAEEQALRISEPLVRNTVDNIYRMGPLKALTGPVVRGDRDVVAGEMEALDAWKPEIRELYRLLSIFALEMARRRALGAENLAGLEDLLTGRPERTGE
jgi:predicted short-subunit dehydrogenase-like oxidoreductase (DUF2520 family)